MIFIFPKGMAFCCQRESDQRLTAQAFVDFWQEREMRPGLIQAISFLD